VEHNLQKSEQRQRRLLKQSRHMQRQLRHLSHQILQAQEEERMRISRDLHDEIAQTLVGINVQLAALTREAAGVPRVSNSRSPARNGWWKNRWRRCISSRANYAGAVG